MFIVLDNTMCSPGTWFWNFLKTSGLLCLYPEKMFSFLLSNCASLEIKQKILKSPLNYKKCWSNIFPNQGSENNTTDLILLSYTCNFASIPILGQRFHQNLRSCPTLHDHLHAAAFAEPLVESLRYRVYCGPMAHTFMVPTRRTGTLCSSCHQLLKQTH